MKKVLPNCENTNMYTIDTLQPYRVFKCSQTSAVFHEPSSLSGYWIKVFTPGRTAVVVNLGYKGYSLNQAVEKRCTWSGKETKFWGVEYIKGKYTVDFG